MTFALVEWRYSVVACAIAGCIHLGRRGSIGTVEILDNGLGMQSISLILSESLEVGLTWEVII